MNNKNSNSDLDFHFGASPALSKFNRRRKEIVESLTKQKIHEP